MSLAPPPDSDLDIEERDKKKLSSSTFFRLFQLILKYRTTALYAVSMILIGTFATLLEPRIFGYAIDEAVVPKRLDLLRWIGLSFVVATCLRIYSASRQAYLFELLGQKVTQDLRLMLFSHLERMPVSLFDRNPSGRLLTRVTNDIGALNEMFSAGFVSMISNSLLVVGILIWLLILDFKLGLIAAAIFPVLAAFSVYFSRRLRVAYREVRNRLSALNAFLAENFSGMKTVHLFNRQDLHLKRFDRLNQGYATAQTGSIRVFAYFQPLITLGAGVSIALIIWFGGKESSSGNLKVGVLVAYFSYILALFQPLREIADKWNVFLSGMASAERIFSILSWDTELDEKAIHLPVTPLNLRGDIEFDQVWFAYEGENWILKDLSLKIRAGEKIGIVGHTGAGKSTLMSLLLRFYEPQKGRILIDGRDIREYELRALRSAIGIVQQDVFLFSGTFAENITFWNPDQLKKVKPLLESLLFRSRNLELVMQERGANLSMGERQVLAFARVAVAEPRIWILDEATANMDSHQEGLLQKSLLQASEGKTGIFIAHRLATICDADRIVVLHRGSLVEIGTHPELLSLKGLYWRLYHFQKSASECLT